jgi:hypothetical protein
MASNEGGFDVCPKCWARRVPRIPPESLATASACQDCGHVVEREPAALAAARSRAAQKVTKP